MLQALSTEQQATVFALQVPPIHWYCDVLQHGLPALHDSPAAAQTGVSGLHWSMQKSCV